MLSLGEITEGKTKRSLKSLKNPGGLLYTPVPGCFPSPQAPGIRNFRKAKCRIISYLPVKLMIEKENSCLKPGMACFICPVEAEMI